MIRPTPDLAALALPSGGLGMVAIDQRESLRLMVAGDATTEPDGTVPAWVRDKVADDVLTQFKVAATQALSPHASAVLLDKEFGFDAVVDAGVVAPGCGLIAAADRFEPAPGEVVGDALLDDTIDPVEVRAQGAVAMKLLVIYRPDEPAARRVDLVERFVQRCRDGGLLSIIEPVSRRPRDPRGAWDEDRWNAGVLAAAHELGGLGADLYKAEVPRRGAGSPDAVRRDCATITGAVASPWVVLSSGVAAEEFPRAVELACAEGASGFLAGRGVWRGCIAAPDVEEALRTEAVARLRRLVEVVDGSVVNRVT